MLDAIGHFLKKRFEAEYQFYDIYLEHQFSGNLPAVNSTVLTLDTQIYKSIPFDKAKLFFQIYLDGCSIHCHLYHATPLKSVVHEGHRKEMDLSSEETLERLYSYLKTEITLWKSSK